MNDGSPPVEFHRPLPVERIGPGGFVHRVEADAAECAALALRLGVPALASLRCVWTLTAGPAGSILAEGRLQARLTRECVVSLDLFEADMDEMFRVRFVPEGRESEDDDPEADDEIPYAAAALDLGEAAAEQLALVLDPYPHKPGAALPDDAEAAALSPFAALARLRRPQ